MDFDEGLLLMLDDFINLLGGSMKVLIFLNDVFDKLIRFFIGFNLVLSLSLRFGVQICVSWCQSVIYMCGNILFERCIINSVVFFILGDGL